MSKRAADDLRTSALCKHCGRPIRTYWRRTHAHEATEDYRQRCQDIARQCCTKRPKESV